MVAQGSHTLSIIGAVRDTFNIVVSKHQVDSVRQREINEILDRYFRDLPSQKRGQNT